MAAVTAERERLLAAASAEKQQLQEELADVKAKLLEEVAELSAENADLRAQRNEDKEVKRIVITGGPCAAISTADFKNPDVLARNSL